MVESKSQLKPHHRFPDYLYWNLLAAVPVVTACLAILEHSIIWLIVYIMVCISLIGFICRFCCTHCPHYIKSTNTIKCMFFWAVPKFFEPRPGPLSLFEKSVSLIATTILILLPFYWLSLQPGLLVIYFLSMAALVLTIRRNECGRCIHFHCPANRVPEDIRRQQKK
ncbi:MAG: hypothetical protein HWN68_10460 [Desulfobacterales bacterium]|nr:hypothetical protein [Desulfobacterales bacterium]